MSNLAHLPPAGKQKSQAGGGALTWRLSHQLRVRLSEQSIVQKLIPTRGVGVVFGDPGAGKTAFAVDLGLHIALGRSFRDRRVRQQLVIYVCYEDAAGIENRIIAARRNLGIADEEAVPFVLVTGANPICPATIKALDEIAAELGHEAFVVIVDTLSQCLPPDKTDNDQGAMANLIRDAQELTGKGATVLFIHHTGKDKSRGARGWSGLLGAIDFELEIKTGRKAIRQVKISKMRNGSTEQPLMQYKVAEYQLGFDEYSDPVTSPVVKYMMDLRVKAAGELKPKARIALDMLRAMGGETEAGVIEKDWREAMAVKDSGVSTAKEEKARDRQVRDAVLELEDTELLDRQGGRIWLVNAGG